MDSAITSVSTQRAVIGAGQNRLASIVRRLGVANENMASAESRIRDYCAQRRDVLLAGLAGISQLRCCVPDAGMFMLIDVRGTGLSGHEFMTDLYRSEGVSVIDGGAFGKGMRDFIRVCFATEESQLRSACERIRRFVDGKKRTVEVNHG